jgi:hypothetical protein
MEAIQTAPSFLKMNILFMMVELRSKMKIEIDKELFQWEKNRYIIFSSEITPIFFAFHNQKSKYSIEVLPKENKAYFPNLLLKEALPITVEMCIGELGEG